MATIHKLTLFIVDPNDIYDEIDEIISDVALDDLYLTYFDAEEKSFEWDDNLPINHFGRSRREYEKYFE